MQPGPVDDDLVPRPTTGRVHEARRRVRLGDVGADGALRLDALARVLQDAATDDRVASGVGGGTWVLRRTAVALGSAPAIGTALEVATWCSGTGARWAERRTDVATADGGVVARAAALWVHVDESTMRPTALPPAFHDVFAPSAAGRTVRARLSHPGPAPSARRRPFPLRVVDLDLLGHVNNAVYWAALEETLGRPETRPPIVAAELEIRDGLDLDDAPDLVTVDDSDATWVWLVVGGEVRASLVGRRR